MAVTKNPLNKKHYLPVTWGSEDFVVPNSVTQTKSFRLPRTDMLTQNSWNFSTRNNSDQYNDVVVTHNSIITRRQQHKFPKR